MRDDHLAGRYDAHVEDRLPWWGWLGFGALILAGAVCAVIWIERIAPGWM